MDTLSLHLDDEARAIRALVALDWMEFPFDASGQAIGRLLGCSSDDATSTWKGLRERQLIELRSRFDVRIPGKPIRSSWKWFPVVERSA